MPHDQRCRYGGGRALIGVFDSGSGGLTVMRALDRALPEESFTYLGDHANAPYGNRSPSEIYELTLRSLERLFDRGCSLVVMACNTAAATGLRRLQRTWLPFAHPSRRVIGVIVPVVEEITGVPWMTTINPATPTLANRSMRIAIFATQHTVDTRAYVAEVESRAQDVRVEQQACPDLVQLIEAAAPEHVIRKTVRRHVRALLDKAGVPDACVLGCTHYPLIEHVFAEELPATVRLLSQAEITAKSLIEYLRRHPEFHSQDAAQRQFLTTGDANNVSALASRYFGRAIQFNSIAGARHSA